MPKTTIKLTTWSLSKKKALAKLNDDACSIFRKVIEGLSKQKVKISSGSVTPVSLKGFLKYWGTYEISVSKKPDVNVSVISRVTYTNPTKKQIKKTPKKIYKRDEKGRFK